MTTKNKKKTGRPKIELDWTEFDKLCALHCTLIEIAEFFDCSIDTIERRVKEKHEMSFAEYFKIKSAIGKISLRRNQFVLAQRNPAMAIFLGKNYLGQKDRHETALSGNVGIVNIEQMSEQQLREYAKENGIEISDNPE